VIDRKLIKLIALLLVSLALGAGAKRLLVARHSVLVLQATSIDLGIIKTNDPIRELRMPITNAGEAPLDLEVAGTSCGCLEAIIPEQSIFAGATGAIVLRVDPHGEAIGPKVQEVLIATNDPQQSLVKLNVRWHVEHEEEVAWLPRKVDQPVSFSSYQNDDVFPGSELTCLIIDSWQGEDLQITSVTSTDSLTTPRVEEMTYGCTDPSKPEAGHAFRLTTSLRQGLKPGKYAESLSIHTNNPTFTRIDIPVVITILPDIEAVPATIVARRNHGVVIREITVKSLAHAPLPDPMHEWQDFLFVTSEWDRVNESTFRLTVQLDTDSNLLSDRFKLPIFSNSSDLYPSLSFRILPD